MRDWIELAGTVSGVALPLFNIPLIVRLVRRKSSADFSLSWALGVWVCIIFMTPQGLRSTDVAFRAYSAVNVVFFTIVTFFILKYHPKPVRAKKETSR
ncbi:MAG TPA: hypothetical protein VL404_04705 [Candidatus Eisenbacteria bacterium]|jgi:hypothetical protein|nr:hypothetical protein [Candidatus Eisenbacteria bacterium]